MSGKEHQEHEEGFLSLQTLIAILILLVYTVAAPLFEKYHFHYMHESGVCMIIGVIVTLLAMIINPSNNMANTLQFNDEMFFTFILPPIIFAAGYNIRTKAFFKYFMYIFLYGVCGTVITFLVVTPLTAIANSYNLFHLTFNNTQNLPPHFDDDFSNNTIFNDTNLNIINNTMRILMNNITISNPVIHETSSIIKFSLKEILLFASVISATDTVAALTFVKEESDPKLFSILFGEGVLNDAVCIVLYRILFEFTSSGEEFSSKTPFKMIGSFMSLFFFSFIVGVVVGILSAIFLKKLKFIKLNRVQETSIVIFFAFISYTLAEEMGLSPIISLLFTGITMSSYTFYNLSFQARDESSVVSRMMSNIAEAFVFTYLGLTMIKSMTSVLSISFIIWELIFVVTGRIAAIFGLAWIIKACNIKNFKLKFSEKGIMSCAGSIRGAIAFGLAISIDTPNIQSKQILINSTLILVFFTTIIFGALMPFLIKFFKSFDEKTEELDVHKPEQHVEGNVEEELFTYMHPNFIKEYFNFLFYSNIGERKEKNKEKLKDRLSYWLGTYWEEFDFVYMKPRLVHNWPYVSEENDKIATKIKNAIDLYNQGKKQAVQEILHNHQNQEEYDNHDNSNNHYEHSPEKTPKYSPEKSTENSPDKYNMFRDMTIKK